MASSAPITLADAQTKLQNAMAAYDAALQAQQYSVTGALRGGGRTVVRGDIDKLGAEVERWRRIVAQLTRGGMRVRRGVPL